MLDLKSETFIVHVVSLSSVVSPSFFSLDVHSSQIEQCLIEGIDYLLDFLLSMQAEGISGYRK